MIERPPQVRIGYALYGIGNPKARIARWRRIERNALVQRWLLKQSRLSPVDTVNTRFRGEAIVDPFISPSNAIPHIHITDEQSRS
jgi:hypothetical protein